MKNIIESNIIPISFIILAGVLGILHLDGWGWCLFLAVVTYNK